MILSIILSGGVGSRLWSFSREAYPKPFIRFGDRVEKFIEKPDKETHNSVIHGGGRLIATFGVKDLIISDTANALLIAHKGRVQDVRGIVDELKSRDDNVYEEFPTTHHPWRAHTVLQEGVILN